MAEKAIAAAQADLISFGRPFIGNPDLVERLRNDWPLADLAGVGALFQTPWPWRREHRPD